jgi:hypothetical protein
MRQCVARRACMFPMLTELAYPRNDDITAFLLIYRPA